MSGAENASRPDNETTESSVVQIERDPTSAGGLPTQPAIPEKTFWTPQKVLFSIAVLVLSGFAEIGGGWLVFQAIRSGKPFWWGILGSLILIIYGFIPTLQPISNFGRVFAVYGGFFIVMSYGWGWLLSSEHPDKGDFVGGGIAIFGVLVAWFWPRKAQIQVTPSPNSVPQGNLESQHPSGSQQTVS